MSLSMSLSSSTTTTSTTPPPLLPTMTSRTPLRESLPLSSLFITTVSNPRKTRNRTSLLVFFSLVTLSFYIFFVQRPSLSSSSSFSSTSLLSSSSSHKPLVAAALEQIKNSPAVERHRKFLSSGQRQQLPQVELTRTQELAAISNFLSSLPSNVVPHTVDPTRPIDPQLILEFDTRGARASEEVEVMVDDVWARNPVFLYAKLYSPISREIKSILNAMHLHPSPTFIDIDIRDDAQVLKPILQRLTGAEDLPILLVGGTPVGTVDEIRAMAESGELKRRVVAAGARVVDVKKKKGKK